MPNDTAVLTWTPTNWITVILMAATGFVLLGFVQKLVKRKQSSAAVS